MEFLSYLASFVVASPPPERSVLGVCLEQNPTHRKVQEDFLHTDLSFGGTSPSPSGQPRCCYLGVYDGHGGHEVAEYVSKKLHSRVLDCMSLMRLESEKSRVLRGGVDGVNGSAAVLPVDVFDGEDVEAGDGGDWTAALKYAYDQIDNDMADDELPFGTDCGSTAATCVVSCSSPLPSMASSLPPPAAGDPAASASSPRYIFTANCGDSHIVLVRHPPFPPLRLTVPHRPTVPSEAARLKEAGAMVFRGRVGGSLAVSRALGHLYDKEVIIGTPDVSKTRIDDKTDSAVVVATDGVWDVLDDKTVADIVNEGIKAGRDAKQIADDIAIKVLQKNGQDNIAVIVLLL